MNKPLIIMGSLLAVTLGGAIILPRIGSTTPVSGSFLEMLPTQEYSQVVWITPDDQIREYIGQQLGNSQAILETLEQVDEFAIAQRNQNNKQETLMIAQGEQIDTSLFNSVGMLDMTDGYQFAQVNDSLVAYGPDTLINTLGDKKDGFASDSLEAQLMQNKKDGGSTVGFLSRPSGAISGGLGLPLSQKMKGTLASIDFKENLIPQGAIDMYFDKGVIQKSSGEWTPIVSSNTSGGSLSIGHILELLGVDKSGVVTFLPFILEQYIGDSIALLNQEDYDRIYEALNDAIRLDMGQSALGNSFVLTLGDPAIFQTLEKVAPFVKPQLQAQAGSGDIVTDFTATQLTRNIQTPQGDFPYLSIYAGESSTSVGLFTDQFDIYSRDTSSRNSDILGSLSISPSMLPVTNTITGKSFWDGVSENLEGEIRLDEDNQRLRLEMR